MKLLNMLAITIKLLRILVAQFIVAMLIAFQLHRLNSVLKQMINVTIFCASSSSTMSHPSFLVIPRVM